MRTPDSRSHPVIRAVSLPVRPLDMHPSAHRIRDKRPGIDFRPRWLTRTGYQVMVIRCAQLLAVDDTNGATDEPDPGATPPLDWRSASMTDPVGAHL